MGPHHSLGPVQVRRMSSLILPSPRVQQLIAAKLDRIGPLGLRIWCRVLCTTTTTITACRRPLKAGCDALRRWQGGQR